LYFASYFRLFKYVVSFSRYFTVCITYQPPLVGQYGLCLSKDVIWITDYASIMTKFGKLSDADQ